MFKYEVSGQFEYKISGHFDAAHYLPKHKGKCANMHGHRWEYLVSILIPSNAPLPDNGMFVDFAAVKIAAEAFDHSLINDHIAIPTAEVIAMFIGDRIASFDLPVGSFVSVEIRESPDCSVTYDTVVTDEVPF